MTGLYACLQNPPQPTGWAATPARAGGAEPLPPPAGPAIPDGAPEGEDADQPFLIRLSAGTAVPAASSINRHALGSREL